MNAIVNIFSAGYRPGFKADIEHLVETGNNTIAVNAASELKAYFVSEGVWNYLG